MWPGERKSVGDLSDRRSSRSLETQESNTVKREDEEGKIKIGRNEKSFEIQNFQFFQINRSCLCTTIKKVFYLPETNTFNI